MSLFPATAPKPIQEEKNMFLRIAVHTLMITALSYKCRGDVAGVAIVVAALSYVMKKQTEAARQIDTSRTGKTELERSVSSFMARPQGQGTAGDYADPFRTEHQMLLQLQEKAWQMARILRAQRRPGL